MLFHKPSKGRGQRCLSTLLQLICILVVISMIPFYTHAADDSAEALAQELYTAIARGQSSVDVTVPVSSNSLNSVLAEAFTRYPALCYYYAGYNSLGYSTHTNVTFHLSNTEIPWEQVYVVNSLEDVKNVMVYSLSQFRSGFCFVTPNGLNVSASDIGDLADEIREENYLSYMGYHGNSISYSNCDFVPVTSYTVTFNYWEGVDLTTLAQWRDATERKASELANSLFAQDMPDYMKELLIHDWLINNCRYNTQDTSAPVSHMAYSGLVSGNPVCQGYTEAAIILLQAAGIPARYVPGEGTNSNGITESHAWNCVQIQGQWYMLDVTWDDPTSQNGTDTLRYTFFNLTSNELARDHTWVYSGYPQCSATAMNYDTVRSLVDSDSGYYYDYSDRNLATRAKAQAQYGPLLETCPIPGADAAAETEPAYSTPDYTTPGYTQPGYTNPGYTTPNYTQPQVKPAQTNPSGGGIGAVAGGLAAIAGIGAGITALIKKRKPKEKEEERPVFDPTDLHF